VRSTDDVHGITARSTARVDEERLFLLILVQNNFEIPVRERNLPPQKAMGLLACDSFEPLK
jgi:hypothetical protein